MGLAVGSVPGWGAARRRAVEASSTGAAVFLGCLCAVREMPERPVVFINCCGPCGLWQRLVKSIHRSSQFHIAGVHIPRI